MELIRTTWNTGAGDVLVSQVDAWRSFCAATRSCASGHHRRIRGHDRPGLRRHRDSVDPLQRSIEWMWSTVIVRITRTWSRPPYHWYGPPVYRWARISMCSAPRSVVTSVTRPRTA